MSRSPIDKALRYILALAIVAGITLFYHRLHLLNPTTVALSYLLAILAVSTFWGMRVAVTMCLGAMLAFNFYFLPPYGKFTIEDPQNWMALFAFLTTAVIASHLSTRIREEANESERRRREIQRLYAFSQRLLGEGNILELLNAVPNYIVEAFEVGAAVLYLVSKKKFYRSGPGAGRIEEDALRRAAESEEPLIDAAAGLCYVPVRLGSRAIGSLGMTGQTPSRQTVEALGTLLAIAMERARAVEELGRTEATREGERLKSALLDSITHDFRTPLTSIKAAVTSLLSSEGGGDAHRSELLTIINEETDRLDHLVGKTAEMARLEAGEVKLELEPQDMREIVASVLEQRKSALGERNVRVQIPAELPKVRADFERTKEVLVQLLDNANLYTPKDQPITVSAEVNGAQLATSVADRGPGIEDLELGMIFQKFYRGKDQRYRVQGTGMGLSIAKAIIEAQGGTISATSQLGRGTVFTFTLPIERGNSESR